MGPFTGESRRRGSVPSILARALVCGVFAVALAAALPACSSSSPAKEVKKELGPHAVVIDVPTIKQKELEECGLAVLLFLLHWSGTPLDDEARARFSLDRVEKEAIAPRELRDYLRSRGFRAELVNGQRDGAYPRGLFAVLRTGVPVIVEVEETGSPRYMLICGYDPEHTLVFFMDPIRGLSTKNTDFFEADWAKADHRMVVAVPPGVAPAPGATPAR